MLEENEILKKSCGVLRAAPALKYAWIEEHQEIFTISAMCRVLEVSRQGFYKWLNRETKPSDERRCLLLIEIRRIMEKTKKTYGVRRVHQALKNRGFECSRGLVENIMSKNDIRPKRIRRYKKTTDSNHSQIVAPNKLNRKFSPLKPNEVWTSDITYLRTREGWLYLCVWIDLYSRKVVGWSIANHMRASLVCTALQDALSRRPGAHPLVHSDRGSQYASTEFRTILWRHRLRQSMSRKGDCWDNAPAESFFGTLKQELDIYCLRPSATLKDEIFEYIEIFYNRRRLHSSLGYKTPEEFDNEYWSVKAAS